MSSPLYITVVYSPCARVVHEVALRVGSDCTVAQALTRSGLLDNILPADVALLSCSVWGQKALLQQVLRDNDRVELCRPLRVAPKLARRQRFVRQGAKAAGLFAARRTGAKAGY